MERRTKTAERPNPASEIRYAELMDQALNLEPGQLQSYNRFYTYSFTNQMLLAMQGVNEPVATYKRWQDMNRQVMKGSKAKAILRPIAYKELNEATGQTESKIRGFKMVNCLFPVSDTEGDPLPEVEPKDWNLSRALGALAINRTPFTETNGNVQGYSIGNEFAVNPVAPYPFKTTIHEIGHIALGHTAPDAHEDYVRHRGTKEFQAESTAYIVLNELELTDHMDAGESRAYIRNWLHDEQPDEAAIKPVFATVDRILKAGRAVPEAEGE